MRNTLRDALHGAFSVGAHGAVASVQNSLRPFRHLFEAARRNRTRVLELLRRYRAPEHEGQHLQSVYPRYLDRAEAVKRFHARGKFARTIPYLADLCTVVTKRAPAGAPQLENVNITHSDHARIGSILLRQWLPYWDSEATFLIQKTPMLDITFLECTKLLPTLHVIIMRHPMTGTLQ